MIVADVTRQAGTNGLVLGTSEVKPTETEGMIGISSRFATLNKLITRDLNNNTTSPTFSKYTKDDIATYLSDPYRYEQQLRAAVTYIYGASSHFRRLIHYFVGLTDWAYIISPYKTDPKSISANSINRNYRKSLNFLSSMNIKTQFPKLLTVALREDVVYVTTWIQGENVIFQQLPSDFCSISTVEGNVPNVTFDFSYFDSRQALLEFYPKEFNKKYSVYLKNRTQKWIELDSPTSFAIKANADILDYAIPPFAGILREVYEIEDYKELRLSKTALENYAMIVMQLGMDDEGNWSLDYNKAVDFWRNLDAVLPEEIGSVLTPMPVNKISFEKSNTASTNTVAEAEEALFTAAGVSSLLFNNEKASANALALSIKADQAITYGVVKSIEDAVNRLLQSQPFGKNFKVTFLDVSPFNRKEVGDQYLKAAQYGLPTVSMWAASQGLGQAELDSMNLLENDILEIKKLFIPLSSSNTQSGNASTKVDSNSATDEGGAPKKDIGDLSDSGEQTQEDS